MGYFYKMAQCDTFVFLNHVEYTKKSFTKRVKIHKGQNVDKDQYIGIPLKKHSDFIPIDELEIASHTSWQKKISAQIYNTYHKAPFYYQLDSILIAFFTERLNSDSFSTFTIEIIKHIAQLIDLQPQWIISSEMPSELFVDNLNIDIVTYLKGEVYISGMGAKKYQNASPFIENGIQLIYSDYKSYFQTLDIPDHFFNKSILSYLAYYELNQIKEFLSI